MGEPTTPSDRDIWACASVLIKQHGESAALGASVKVDWHSERGDLQGRDVWLRILRAVEWLQDNRGRDPFKVEH